MFRPGHSNITATTLFLNNIVNAFDAKIHRAALLVDLSMAFDKVGHSILLSKLSSKGLVTDACMWFQNYHNNRIQATVYSRSPSLP